MTSKRLVGGLVLSLALIGMFSFAAAGFWGDFWSSITGNAINLDDGLVGYWKFDEDLVDSIGDNDATKNGQITYTDDTLAMDDQFSIAVWFKPITTQEGGLAFVYSRGIPTGFYYGLFIQNNKLAGSVWSTSSVQVGTTASISAGEWYHGVLVYDGAGSTLKLYLNGNLASTETSVPASIGSESRTPNNIYLGGGQPNGWDFNGVMDDVRLYDRVLTEEEISAIYLDVDGEVFVVEDSQEQEEIAEDSEFNENSVQYCYIGCRNKKTIVEDAGITNIGSISVISLDSADGTGGSVIVNCPSGDYDVCVQNNNDGAGNSVLLGVIYSSEVAVQSSLPASCDSDAECIGPGEKKYCDGNSACVQQVSYTCVNPGSEESYCDEVVTGEAVCDICDNNCYSGFCTNESFVAGEDYCIDTDDGFNFYKLGGTEGRYESGGVTYEFSFVDRCKAGVLTEYKCVNGSNYETTNTNCTWGCDVGKCLKSGFPSISSCGGLLHNIKQDHSDFEVDGVIWQLVNSGNKRITAENDSLIREYKTSYFYDPEIHDQFDKWVYYSQVLYEKDGGFSSLSESLDSLAEAGICRVEEYYTNEEERLYYICDSSYIDNALGNERNYLEVQPDRTVFWIKDNYLFAVDINFYEEQQPSFKDDTNYYGLIGELVEGLDSYGSPWQDVELPLVVKNILVRDLILCISDFVGDIDEEICYPQWSCEVEPLVCEDGTQTRTCVDEAGCYNKRVEEYSCDTGACSGCYLPNFLGEFDERCIPQGKRLQLDGGWDYVLNEGTEISDEALANGDDALLDIGSEDYASLNLAYLNKTYDLSVGTSVKIDNEKVLGNKLSFNVAQISLGSDSEPGFVDLSFDSGKDELGVYCSKDWTIKEQKTRNVDTGRRATCLQGYECESNICLNGYCLELGEVTTQITGVEGVWAKSTCRFSDFFGIKEYERCLGENFGQLIDL
jgi:hypothetical protein